MAWIAAAGAVAGAFVSARSARRAADDQMAFQEQQSRTQHIRAVNDLRAAGLNPILAAHTGNAAMGGAQPSQFFNPAEGVTAFREQRRANQEIRVMKEQERKTANEADTAESTAKVADFERRVVDALRHNFRESGVEVEAKRRLEQAKAGSTASSLERQLDEESGELFRTLNRLGITGSTGVQILRSLRR